jgi:hypothetical protein
VKATMSSMFFKLALNSSGGTWEVPSISTQT